MVYNLLVGVARSCLALGILSRCIMAAGACLPRRAFRTNMVYNLLVGVALSCVALGILSRCIMAAGACLPRRAFHTNMVCNLLVGVALNRLAYAPVIPRRHPTCVGIVVNNLGANM